MIPFESASLEGSARWSLGKWSCDQTVTRDPADHYAIARLGHAAQEPSGLGTEQRLAFGDYPPKDHVVMPETSERVPVCHVQCLHHVVQATSRCLLCQRTASPVHYNPDRSSRSTLLDPAGLFLDTIGPRLRPSGDR